MSALARVALVAEMQARDLLRRRAVMVLYVALPAAFYYSVPASEEYSLVASLMGVSWAVGAAGLFGILGWQQADPRLVLAGAAPRDGLVGRLIVLVVLATALLVLFVPQILVRSSALIVDRNALLAALAAMAAVSVPLGLAIGALVPRELEGTLVLIGILGVGMSVPPETPGGWVQPLWGPVEMLTVAAGWTEKSLMTPALHTAGFALALLALAAWRWRMRTRIER